jgi:hypothetical protein
MGSQAILDVVMRHARGHDRHDAKLMNSCFWDDGVDEHGQFGTPPSIDGRGRAK